MSGRRPPLPVTWRGRPVALADPHVIRLMPPFALLERDHPVRRFAVTLCLCALELDERRGGAPYDEAQAEERARQELMPDVVFTWLSVELGDVALAERFNVPLDQVLAKHVDLELGTGATLPPRPSGWRRLARRLRRPRVVAAAQPRLVRQS